jgi:WD40 repeat protein
MKEITRKVGRWLAAVFGQPLFVVRNPGFVNSMAFSPDGTILATADSGYVRCWNVADGSPLDFYLSVGNPVESICFSPDGTFLVTGTMGLPWVGQSNLIVWSMFLKNGWRYFETYSGVRCVAFSQDGALLASGDDEGVVKVWDMGSGKLLHTLEGHKYWINCVAFLSDGGLLSGDDGNTVMRWDVPTATLQRTWKIRDEADRRPGSIKFSPDGSILACGRGETVTLHNAIQDRLTHAFGGHEMWLNLAFSPDGSILAVGDFDSRVKLWDTQSGARLRTLRGDRAGVTCIAYSPDGKRLALGRSNGIVEVRDLRWVNLLQLVQYS